MNTKYIFASIFFSSVLLFGSAEAWSCEHCRPLVISGVYNEDFFANFLLITLPLAVLAVLGVLTHYGDAILAALQSRKGDKHG